MPSQRSAPTEYRGRRSGKPQVVGLRGFLLAAAALPERPVRPSPRLSGARGVALDALGRLATSSRPPSTRTFAPRHAAADLDQQRLTAGEAVGGATVLLLAAVRGRSACSRSALGRRCGFSKLEGFALFTFSLQGAQWSLRRMQRSPALVAVSVDG